MAHQHHVQPGVEVPLPGPQPHVQEPVIVVVPSKPVVPIEPFDPSEGPLSEWISLFNEKCRTLGYQPEPADGEHNDRRAYFLSSIGRRGYSVLTKACRPDNPISKTIPQLGELLRETFEPRGRAAAHEYEFSIRLQRPNEKAIDYLNELQELASKCDFGQFLERALVQRLRAGVRDPQIRRKLLAEAQLTSR